MVIEDSRADGEVGEVVWLDSVSLEAVGGFTAAVTEGTEETGKVILCRIFSVAVVRLVSGVVFEGSATVLVVEEAGEVALLCICSLSFEDDGSIETLVDCRNVLVVEEALWVVMVVCPVFDNLSLAVAETLLEAGPPVPIAGVCVY